MYIKIFKDEELLFRIYFYTSIHFSILSIIWLTNNLNYVVISYKILTSHQTLFLHLFLYFNVFFCFPLYSIF